jgi:hypothetical protein
VCLDRPAMKDSVMLSAAKHLFHDQPRGQSVPEILRSPEGLAQNDNAGNAF